jgi:hypothetical protein
MWDQADVAYATVSPPGNYEMKLLESWSGTGNVAFHEARWEDLPTMANIVNALAALPVHEVTNCSMGRVLVAFNDLSDQRILK